MEDFDQIHGFRVADDICEMDDVDDFRDDDYAFLEWELRWRETHRRAKPDRTDERMRVIRETFAKAAQLAPEELRSLRNVPRFNRNIRSGKNWSISEDLTVLTLNLTKKQLARLLHRTPNSIRKRWSTLRQYGLHRRSMVDNHEDEDNGK
ncbi:MAG: hypothetical protein JRG73_03830 [Deltaproteobacteria bacterium]|nr:hypothetical protein [Deltaproteobacteria bacterium]MBW2306043.1 hypothetical protein [Deltaproteobacteria bacterium]